MSYITPCTRCGKLRVVAKTWNEQIGQSKVTYTQTVCPDPVCQEIVDSELQKKQDKITEIQNKSLERRKTINRTRKSKKNH